MFAFLAFPGYAIAQTLAGKVTDAETGAPITGAAVFINNSTYGTTCDGEGRFALDRNPPPPFQLVATAVGYESGSYKVDRISATEWAIKLKPKKVGLQEVTVMSGEKDGWVKYGQLFTEDFIGYSPFATQCKIVNKDVLQFYYDKDRNVLKVWAEKPLLIRNEATGYLVRYQLEDFEKNFSTRKLYFKGYIHYTNLETKKEKQKKKWAANRLYAYNGSMNHFFRSVYKRGIAEEGFEVRTLKRIKSTDYGRYVPMWTDTIRFGDTSRMTSLFREIFKDTSDKQGIIGAITGLLKWKNDQLDTAPVKLVPPGASVNGTPEKEYIFSKSKTDRETMVVSFYDFNRLSPEDSIRDRKMSALVKVDGMLPRLSAGNATYDIVYRPLVLWDSIVVRAENSLRLLFPGHLQITYTLEPEEVSYLGKSRGKRSPADNQVSVISLTEEQGVEVFRNGNFSPAYALLVEQYWSYEKLDKLLPLDFEP